MLIRFLNPVEQVTGSCYWLRDAHREVEFLVDCGMEQGLPTERKWNTRKFEFNPRKLQCVFLTHSHLDHCGLLPRLAKEGFGGLVYCTKETAELARISLRDAARQPDALYTEVDVDRLKFHTPAGQLFGKLHPFGTDLFFGFYRNAHIVGSVAIQIVWGPKPGVGEASTQRQITFSGDLGSNAEGVEHQPLIRYRMRPPPATYAVVESTYGSTVRPAEEADFHARIGRLQAAVDRGLFGRNGIVIIPCFSIDRTQTVLFDLDYIFRASPERYRRIPVFLHSPMAAKVNRVYSTALKRKETIKAAKLKSMWLNKRLFEWLSIDPTPEGEAQIEAHLTRLLSPPKETGTFRIESRTGSIEGDRSSADAIYSTISRPPERLLAGNAPFPPSIFVTGGGMCSGGPVLSYLAALLTRESTSLILTGYLPPSTIGGALLAHSQLPREERRRSSEHIDLPSGPVRLSDVVASIEKVAGYSGHADQQGLVDWLFSIFTDKQNNEHLNLAGRTVFITHGDETQRRALRVAIEAKSSEWCSRYPEEHQPVEIHCPRRLDRDTWFDLDGNRWIREDTNRRTALEDRVRALEERLAVIEDVLQLIAKNI